jgi:hypothetical protein
LILIQPFFFVDAANFQFTRFIALIPEIEPGNVTAKGIVAVLSSFALFAAPRRCIARNTLALCFAFYFLSIYLRVLPADGLANGILAILISILVVIFGRLEHLRPVVARGQKVFLPLMIFALIAWFFFSVQMLATQRLQMLMLLAALRLSLEIVREVVVSPQQSKSHEQFLLLMGCLFSGWVTLGWSLHELEWKILYQFFPPSVVENQVVYFLPIIVLRYAVPVVICRLVLALDVAKGALRDNNFLKQVMASKFISLGVVAIALAEYNPHSNVYLEAIQQLCIWVVIALALW